MTTDVDVEAWRWLRGESLLMSLLCGSAAACRTQLSCATLCLAWQRGASDQQRARRTRPVACHLVVHDSMGLRLSVVWRIDSVRDTLPRMTDRGNRPAAAWRTQFGCVTPCCARLGGAFDQPRYVKHHSVREGFALMSPVEKAVLQTRVICGYWGSLPVPTERSCCCKQEAEARRIYVLLPCSASTIDVALTLNIGIIDQIGLSIVVMAMFLIK